MTATDTWPGSVTSPDTRGVTPLVSSGAARFERHVQGCDVLTGCKVTPPVQVSGAGSLQLNPALRRWHLPEDGLFDILCAFEVWLRLI